MEELIDGTVDQHSDNQRRIGLPSRLIAKIFLFRLIFGGTAFAYASDSDFADVGWDARKWQGAIDAFYEKYRGLEKWHGDLVRTVIADKQLVMPTGRIYTFQPYEKRGELVWPRTQILNYPVQGLGADWMSIARVIFKRLLRESPVDGLLLNSTVHDSIMCDVPKKGVDSVVELLFKTWTMIPDEFHYRFGVTLNLPMRCEVQIGPDWGNMEDVKL